MFIETADGLKPSFVRPEFIRASNYERGATIVGILKKIGSALGSLYSYAETDSKFADYEVPNLLRRDQCMMVLPVSRVGIFVEGSDAKNREKFDRSNPHQVANLRTMAPFVLSQVRANISGHEDPRVTIMGTSPIWSAEGLPYVNGWEQRYGKVNWLREVCYLDPDGHRFAVVDIHEPEQMFDTHSLDRLTIGAI